MGKSGHRLFIYIFVLLASTTSVIAEAESPPIPNTANRDGHVVLTPPNVNAQQLGSLVNGSVSLSVGPVPGNVPIDSDDIAAQAQAALSDNGSLQSASRGAGPSDRAPSSGTRTPCEIFYGSGRWTLADLDYVGFPFTERFTVRHCINAYTDEQAREATGAEQCPNSTNGRIINMGNPQYFSRQDGERLQAIARQNNIGNGEYTMARDSNPFGFYLCVTRNPAYEKSAICEGMNDNAAIRDQSGWPRETLNRLLFRWRSTGDGDGNCECTVRGEQNWQLCTRPEDIPEEPCARYGMQPDNRQGPPGNITFCECQGRSNQTGEMTTLYVPSGTQQCVDTENPVEPPTEPTAMLKRCVDSWRERAAHCRSASETARTACAAVEQQNRPSNEAVNALSGASDFHTQARAGSGAQNQCFNASLISTSAINTIRGNQQSCDDEFNSCVTSCRADQVSEFEQSCSALIAGGVAAQPASGSIFGNIAAGAQRVAARHVGQQNPLQAQFQQQQQALNQQYFDQHREAISSAFTSGNEVCAGEVREQRTLADRTLASLGDSLSQSTRCMCQLSASGGNCATATPTVAECTANPSLPACAIYQALNACAPGSSYNPVACNCELNPLTAGCRAASTNSLSSFASPSARIAAAAAVGAPPEVATASAGMPSSGVDLTGSAEDGEMAGLAAGDGSDGLGQGAPVAGRGAGALGGGGTVGGTEGEGEDEQKSGLSGMFNSAKTFLSKLKGGKTKENGALGTGDDRVGPNGFPRGLASERGGLGKKNTDIWKLMNACVQGETCRANQGNYITTP